MVDKPIIHDLQLSNVVVAKDEWLILNFAGPNLDRSKYQDQNDIFHLDHRGRTRLLCGDDAKPNIEVDPANWGERRRMMMMMAMKMKITTTWSKILLLLSYFVAMHSYGYVQCNDEARQLFRSFRGKSKQTRAFVLRRSGIFSKFWSLLLGRNFDRRSERQRFLVLTDRY